MHGERLAGPVPIPSGERLRANCDASQERDLTRNERPLLCLSDGGDESVESRPVIGVGLGADEQDARMRTVLGEPLAVQPREVSDVLRHEDSPLAGSALKDLCIRIALQIWVLNRGKSVDSTPAQFRCHARRKHLVQEKIHAPRRSCERAICSLIATSAASLASRSASISTG